MFQKTQRRCHARPKSNSRKHRTRRSPSISSSSSLSSVPLDLDNDEGYSGVDAVPDSGDDDEDDIFAAEEQHMVGAVHEDGPTPMFTGIISPHSHFDHESDSDADAEDGEEEDDDDDDDDDDGEQGDDRAADQNDLGLYETQADGSRFEDEMAPLVAREVRFCGVAETDSDLTSDENGIDKYFPDLLIEQYRRPWAPEFCKTNFLDMHLDDSSGECHDIDHECYDNFAALSQSLSAAMGCARTPSTASSASLAYADPALLVSQTDAGEEAEDEKEATGSEESNDSDYSDDDDDSDGSTTDEEEAPYPLIRQVPIRPIAPPSSDSDSARPVRVQHGQPRLTRFTLDDLADKPIAVYNVETGKTMIFTAEPREPVEEPLLPMPFDFSTLAPGWRSTDASAPLADAFPNSSVNLPASPFNHHAFSSPAMSASALASQQAAMLVHATLTNQLNSPSPLRRSDVFLNAVPAQFPAAEMGYSSDQSCDTMEEPSDWETPFNFDLAQYVHYPARSDKDEEEDAEGDAETKKAQQEQDGRSSACKDDLGNDGNAGDTTTITTTTPAPKLGEPGANSASAEEKASQVHPLFAHFDNNSNAVGAFRRDQLNQRLISSNMATPESLSFSNPYYYGTLRGIKDGSLQSVTTSITLGRRASRRHTLSTSNQSSPGLLGVGLQSRVSLGNTHKRTAAAASLSSMPTKEQVTHQPQLQRHKRHRSTY